MDERTALKELQHQMEVAERAALIVTDQTTAQRFRAFANDVRKSLLRLLRKRKTRERAYELWEQAGRPTGRDQEFWFEAEREIEGPDET